MWQTSLVDSEVTQILQGHFLKTRNRTQHTFRRRRHEEIQATESKQPVEQQDLVDDEVCAICQENMDTAKPLTFCKTGCGNNFHLDCSTYL